MLTDEQVQLLDKIGMHWESVRDVVWDRYFAAAKQYYADHGDLLVNISDNTLGRWIAQLRNYRKSNIQSPYLTPERVAVLDAIGVIWDVPDYLWERNYAAAVEYHRTHGDLEVPADYVDQNGIRLGAWLFNVRAGRKDGNGRM